jgi:hypothetical protein
MVAVDPSCLASGLINPVCQGVSGVGSSIISSGASSVFDAMATWVGSGSAWLLGQIGSALNTSTTVTLDAPWFLDRYRAAEGILSIVALPLLLATAIQAIFQQRPMLLVRAAFVQLPLAMVFAGAAVELVTMALSITDQLSSALSTTSPGAIQALMTSIASTILASGATAGTSAPAFIGLLGALVVAVAALVLWVELVIRTAAIYVAVAFLPLVLVSMVWPTLASWSRRLVETLLALILSKLVVVAVLEMAVGALGSQQGAGFSTVVTGIALLMLAAFAPFSLLRLLPMFESSAALALEGLRQRGVQSAMHGAPRQAASLATAMATKSPPLALAMASGSPKEAGSGLSSSAGEESQESPMTRSAISSSDRLGDAPIVSPSKPSPSRPLPPAPEGGTSGGRSAAGIESVRWPGGEPEEPRHGSKLGSLVLDRDRFGPIIAQRPSVEDERRGK